MSIFGPQDVSQAAGTGTADAAAGKPRGAMGKDEFLQLLVAQLSNQDPLNPLEGHDFAAQLAQFTSLEQLISINQSIGANAQMSGILAQSINSGVAAGLIGKEITAAGNVVEWSGESEAELHFELAGPARNVTVRVLDSSGAVIRTIDAGSFDGGEQSVAWDGKTSKGVKLASGTYTYEVEASDPNGDPIGVAPFVRGTVDRVTFGQNGILLWLGGRSVPMSEVESVE